MIETMRSWQPYDVGVDVDEPGTHDSLQLLLTDISAHRAADAGRGGRARQADRARRHRGEAPDGRVEPAARRLDRKAVPRHGSSAPRPDPGGGDRPRSRRERSSTGGAVTSSPRTRRGGSARRSSGRSRTTPGRSAFRFTRSNGGARSSWPGISSRPSSAGVRPGKIFWLQRASRRAPSTRSSRLARTTISLNQRFGSNGNDPVEFGELLADPRGENIDDELEQRPPAPTCSNERCSPSPNGSGSCSSGTSGSTVHPETLQDDRRGSRPDPGTGTPARGACAGDASRATPRCGDLTR